MVRPARAQPCATAHQPKASDTKNSLNVQSIYLMFWFAVPLSCISCAPFSGFMARKGPSSLLRQFRVTVGCLFEVIF